jgi:hypothetical protein
MYLPISLRSNGSSNCNHAIFCQGKANLAPTFFRLDSYRTVSVALDVHSVQLLAGEDHQIHWHYGSFSRSHFSCHFSPMIFGLAA